MTATVLFTGGGSAGHVVPNLALIDACLADKMLVSYMGSEEGIERTLTAPLNIPYYAIATGKLRRYMSVKNLLDLFKVLLGIFQAWKYVGKVKPAVVFSKGGFVAFPVVFAAWLRGVPVIAHESDFTPGLANRLSFPFVKKIAMTFPTSKDVTKCGTISVGVALRGDPIDGRRQSSAPKKIVVTGTPLRKSLFQGDAKKGREIAEINNDLPCLMVIGGGSGATVINDAVRKALPTLLPTMNVIHCCGKGKVVKLDEKSPLRPPLQRGGDHVEDFECSAATGTRERTTEFVINNDLSAETPPLKKGGRRGDFLPEKGTYTQFEYVNEELPHLYACADCVISRAGANTVYEILALQKPTLFIPLSLKASRGDQIDNANFLASQGLCEILEEEKLTPETLIKALQTVINQQTMMQEKMKVYSEQHKIKEGTQAIMQLMRGYL